MGNKLQVGFHVVALSEMRPNKEEEKKCLVKEFLTTIVIQTSNCWRGFCFSPYLLYVF